MAVYAQIVKCHVTEQSLWLIMMCMMLFNAAIYVVLYTITKKRLGNR